MRQPTKITRGVGYNFDWMITWNFAGNRRIVLYIGNVYGKGTFIVKSLHNNGYYTELTRENLEANLQLEELREAAVLSGVIYAPAG